VIEQRREIDDFGHLAGDEPRHVGLASDTRPPLAKLVIAPDRLPNEGAVVKVVCVVSGLRARRDANSVPFGQGEISRQPQRADLPVPDNHAGRRLPRIQERLDHALDHSRAGSAGRAGYGIDFQADNILG